MKTLLLILVLIGSAWAWDEPVPPHPFPQMVEFGDDNAIVFYEAPELTGDIVMSVGPQYLELCGNRIVGEGCSKLTWEKGVFEFEGNATVAAKEFLRVLNQMGAEFCRREE